MPAPFLFHRPSGFFCRFLVPADLRCHFGTRFIVRALFTSDRNCARLSAAILAISITHLCDQLRRGESIDMNKKLADFRPSFWNAGKVTLPNGTVLNAVEITDDADQARFCTMLGIQPAAAVKPVASQLLSLCIDDFILERKKGGMAVKSLSEYEYILRTILLGTCEDRSMSLITTDMTNDVIRLLQGWPANATKQNVFNRRSPGNIVKLAAFMKMPTIQTNTRNKYLDRLRSVVSAS